jgi:wyosine [tRNA(Phe)-imidazoG37] synthetase (radical SAM superfamily)
MLTITDHRRDSVGLKYVYPVISRRAGGLSIGINLNTNNACNWRCIYCQVPGLQRGTAPEIDLKMLEQELRNFLNDVLQGNFYVRHNIPPRDRGIRDIAISGNGEPTSAREFDKVVERIGKVISNVNLSNQIKIVLTTNGSLLGRNTVQTGVARLAELNGEVWFKLDSATEAGIRHINNVNMPITTVRKNLNLVSRLCPTWLQTCVFRFDDKPPSEAECKIYLQFISEIVDDGVPLKGVLLYGVARPSMQPEVSRLSPLPQEWLEQYATEIRKSGIEVKVSV